MVLFRSSRRLEKVAYKLKLPSTSNIHPVIHVSQLKKAIGKLDKVEAELPEVKAQELDPEMTLGTRWRKRDGVARQQVLIHWQGLTEDLATWEDLENSKIKFPEHPAWGQAGSQEGG